VLCRNFYNSVNPRGPTTTEKRDRDPFLEFGLDRSSHHKKVRNWFMKPTKYKTEIASEQQSIQVDVSIISPRVMVLLIVK